VKLDDIKFIELIPQFMREDETVKSLAESIDKLIPDISKKMQLNKTWNKIDEMNHQDLNELAWELNIIWYDQSVSLEQKRRIIKQSDLIYARLGTKWAVEQIIETYFGSGKVKEWFEYGGEPHYFRIYSDNPQITNNDIDKFMWLLNIVKRKSSWLEGIYITLTGETRFYTNMITVDCTHEKHYFGGNRNIELYNNIFIHETNEEQIKIKRSEIN